MTRWLILASATVFATPLSAQDHSAHGGHTAQSTEAPPKPEMDHCAMGHLPPERCPPKTATGTQTAADPQTEPPVDHSAHGMTMDHEPNKSASGAAPESAVPQRAFEGPRHAADSIWGEQAMAPSRKKLAHANGGMKTGVMLAERLEARLSADGGEHGFLWDAQGWYGGDINRFVLKTEGEGEFGGAVEDAEIQALFSHAIGPFFDLQAGVRFDLEPDTRSHIVVGVQGLAPYMLHVDGALFLSDKGDLTARIEGEYDQKLTQQLILQPRFEIELAAQDIAEGGIAAGITNIEPGVRLRYEISPQFAPYIGVEYEAKIGGTADLARQAGEDPDGLKLIVGLRAWF